MAVTGPGSATPSQDIVPLSVRVMTMLVSRLILTPATYLAAAVGGVALTRTSVCVSLGYLLITGLLSSVVLLPGTRWAVSSFGMSLLLDGVYLQYQHEVIGHNGPIDIAIVTHLVMVCLLASFRSGLRLAIWQSILMVFALRAEQAGLFPMPGWAAGLDRERILVVDCGLYWLAVLAASTTAAVNERELRRRRYDADALREFAEKLQTDQRPADVGARLCRFVGSELLATRVLVCVRGSRGWRIEASRGIPSGIPMQADRRQPRLFTIPPGTENEVLSLHLDPGADQWLAKILPGARGVIGIRLAGSGSQDPEAGRWLILEQANRRGRVDSRLITTAAQAAATAAIAISRAELVQAAQRAAATDGLTGLANRRTFDAQIAALLSRMHTSGEPFALILADVDKFKSINDQHGHQAGDQSLQAVARCLAQGSRAVDLASRYGGEEFAVLLPGASGQDAEAVAERLRDLVQRMQGPVPMTASFGVASAPADASTVQTLIFMADSALINAKQTGRNRVVRAADLALGQALELGPAG